MLQILENFSSSIMLLIVVVVVFIFTINFKHRCFYVDNSIEKDVTCYCNWGDMLYGDA